MNILIDAQLPKSLKQFFPGDNVTHTSYLKEGNKTKDTIINSLSFEEKYAVFTKDSDFYYSYIASTRPYKLVFIKLGNMRIQQLKDYFSRNAATIVSLLENHSFLIIETDKIRVLD
jgi:predicted nuclease of predicted toxin-antitoxin system